MKPAWAIGNASQEVLQVSAQFGVENIVVYSGPGSTTMPGSAMPLGKPRAEYADYLALRRQVESYGLRIVAIEGGFVGNPRYHDVVFGGPKRDEMIEGLIAEVRDMARAGIPIYG